MCYYLSTWLAAIFHKGCFSNRVWGTNTKMSWEFTLRSHPLKISPHPTLWQLIPLTSDTELLTTQWYTTLPVRKWSSTAHYQCRGGVGEILFSPAPLGASKDADGVSCRHCCSPDAFEWNVVSTGNSPCQAGQAIQISVLFCVVLYSTGSHPFFQIQRTRELCQLRSRISAVYILVKDAIYHDVSLITIPGKTCTLVLHHLLLRSYNLYYQPLAVMLWGPKGSKNMLGHLCETYICWYWTKKTFR